MLTIRHVLATLAALASLLACSSKSRAVADSDASASDLLLPCADDAGQECLCIGLDAAQICFESGTLVPACDCSIPATSEAGAPALPVPPIDAAVNVAAPFLGTWTLLGTEQYVCAAETSDIIPESATMTFRPGPGASDAGQVDLLFDGGLGCSIAMSVINGAAALTSAPQTCGVQGKPIDRVFLAVQATPAVQLPGWLRLEETFTDQSGCTFLEQGYLLP